MTHDHRQHNESPGINPGYPLLQLARALTTAEDHPDPATRARAQRRIEQWQQVFTGLLSGKLGAGSRTPLAGVPAWATLEVVTGGFATGELLAGGPLQDYELAWLEQIGIADIPDTRRLINGFFLTDAGLARLQALLQSQHYEIDVPEAGALLVVAWLLHQGHADQARELLDTIGPWFPRLRFYPRPVDRPRRFGAQVFLQDVGTTTTQILQTRPNLRILAQKEAIEIWAPLYDRMVSLFLETVEGEPPDLERDPDGNWSRSPDGRFPVVGGWPCRHYPPGWRERGLRLLAEYEQQRQSHTLSGRPERSKHSFAQLRDFLRRILVDPSQLSGRDVGRIRLILARSIASRGVPGTPTHQTFRERQALQSRAPTFRAIAELLAIRLEQYQPAGGLEDTQPVVQPITPAEAERYRLTPDAPVPPSLRRKVERSQIDTVDALIERGIITSADTLAQVLPQLTATIRAAGIADPQLRHLYAGIYRAFRRRRSLLLLNFEQQVQIEELPWVAAIDRFRHDNLSTRELARQTLSEVVLLTLTAFPQAIIPNKLLQELRALAKTARLDLPLVDELAADIFMGDFATSFTRAAKHAADLLEGTLYAAYYGIDYRQVRNLPDQPVVKRRWFKPDRGHAGERFISLCETRAGVRAAVGIRP
jgi:hypothetical protein